MPSNGTTSEAAGLLLFGRALVSEEEAVGSECLGCQLTLCRAAWAPPACAGLGAGPGEAQGALARQDWVQGRLGLGSALPLCSAAPQEMAGRGSWVTAINSFIYCGVNLSAYGEAAANKDKG